MYITSLVGQRFGHLRVLALSDYRGAGKKKAVYYECVCDCGNMSTVQSSTLKSGRTKTCGRCHFSRELKSVAALDDLTGRTFGRLTVLRRDTSHPIGASVYWIGQCSCGKVVSVSADQLRKGETKSCGCYHREVMAKWCNNEDAKYLTHVTLSSIQQRCENPRHKSYDRYGGRGITICDEWRKDPESFVRWALENGFRKGLTIDRIDTNKGYSPDNCRWITFKEQANNRSNNRLITVFDTTHTISEWADIINMDPQDLWQRDDDEVEKIIRNNWDIWM